MQCKNSSMQKTECIHMRVSKIEKERICKEAEQLNMSVAKYLVYLSEHKQIVEVPFSKELAEELYQVNQNMNEILRLGEIPVQELRNIISHGITRINQIIERQQ